MVRAWVLCTRALGACTHSVCVLRVRVHLFSSLYSDVFRALKHQTEDIQDDNLRSRAANLPKFLQSRWAATTNRKYNHAWERWVHWCSLYSASSCPACTFYIAVYLNDLVLEGCKIGALSAAASGIRWGHVMSGQVNPMDNLFVKTALEGAKRTVGKDGSGRQKEPFTTDMVKQVVLAYGNSSNLLHHRSIIMCLLGFSGLLRICELLGIKVVDMIFTYKGLKLTIPQSKSDQIRGHVVHIDRTGTPYCPVQWTEDYILKTTLAAQPNAYLMCRLAKTKYTHRAIGNQRLCYTTVRAIFVRDVLPICQSIEPGAYCLHSLRSGGASAAINNGVSERLIGKYGRWKSGYSRDRYLRDDKDTRLSVTLALGL